MQEMQSDHLSNLFLSKYKWHYGTFAQCHFAFHSYTLGDAGKKSCRSVSQNTVVWEVSLCLVQPLKKKNLCTIICYYFYFCLPMCKQMVFDSDSCLMLELKGNIVTQHPEGKAELPFIWIDTLNHQLYTALWSAQRLTSEEVKVLKVITGSTNCIKKYYHWK